MSRDVQLRRQDQYQLPPVWVRLTRDRLVLAALVVITALALVSGQLTEGARLQLEASIDSHWRGAYDLLVVPKGACLGRSLPPRRRCLEVVHRDAAVDDHRRAVGPA